MSETQQPHAAETGAGEMAAGGVSPRLQHLETVIDKGARAFVEVGLALFEIRENRMYRERGFTRFSDYCQEKWGLSTPHANHTIRGARVMRELEMTSTEVMPSCESQTRQLAPLLDVAPEKMASVWAEVVAGGVPSAPRIRAKVQSVLTGIAEEPPAELHGPPRISRKPVAVRAKEIESLAVDGASSSQIARQLGIREGRVREIATQCGLVIPGDQVTRKTRRLDPNHVMEQTVAEISESVDMTIGLLQGRWSDLDPGRIEDWRDSLEAAARSVNRLIKELSHVATTV